MTMTLPATTPVAAPSAAREQVLRIVVALFGAIEGITSLSDLTRLSGDLADIVATTLHPILGLATVILALTGKLRYGIAALAALVLTQWAAQWASDLPSIFREGVNMTASAFVNADIIFKIVVQPIIGCGAIAAAWFNRHLTAATVALTLPTLVQAAGIAAFAISVMLYGF